MRFILSSSISAVLLTTSLQVTAADLSQDLYVDRLCRDFTKIGTARTYDKNGAGLVDESGFSSFEMQHGEKLKKQIEAEQLARSKKFPQSCKALSQLILASAENDTAVRLYLDRAVVRADMFDISGALQDCDKAISLDNPANKWRGLWLKSLILKDANRTLESLKTLNLAVTAAKDWPANDVFVRELRRQ
ncbi:MAG TPA: hypothetical protein V6C89_21880 [Drouetiella sp.]